MAEVGREKRFLLEKSKEEWKMSAAEILVAGIVLLALCGLPYLFGWAAIQQAYQTKEERAKAWRKFVIDCGLQKPLF